MNGVCTIDGGAGGNTGDGMLGECIINGIVGNDSANDMRGRIYVHTPMKVGRYFFGLYETPERISFIQQTTPAYATHKGTSLSPETAKAFMKDFHASVRRVGLRTEPPQRDSTDNNRIKMIHERLRRDYGAQ
jgi:hypothetical protein